MAIADVDRPTLRVAGVLPPEVTPTGLQRFSRWFRNHFIQFCAAAALIFMFIPVLVVFIFSFNNPAGRYNYVWQQFSFDAWGGVTSNPDIYNSLILSLKIGFMATIISTVLGTLIAFAIGRHRFTGRALTNLVIFMPMATPEVVMGASLLALFINVNQQGNLGIWTITIAHIMFCISFVVVTVKARIAGLDPRLEQAAADLYANEATTFWKITFPLVLPGIVAGALLAFSLSFDDFVITHFTAGTASTFPVYVWGTYGKGIPPEANVVGSAMFIIALMIVLIPELARTRSRKASA
jgi:spermidine/putrescine transport system permease protein